MKRLLSTALLVVATAFPVNAREAKCQGELYQLTPPVPNNPTHIRNVVWRNAKSLREACQRQVAQSTSKRAANSQQPSPANLLCTPKQTQQ